MSNQAVGQVYQVIINEVIEASRTDFDDGGVEDVVLEELRKVNSTWPVFWRHLPSAYCPLPNARRLPEFGFFSAPSIV